MITPDMIPDEVVEACAELFGMSEYNVPFLTLPAHTQRRLLNTARAAIAAALSAWKGATYAKWRDYGQADRLVLPLPQEGDA